MIDNLQLRHDDVLYCPFPMFHIDATVLTVVPAMLLATTAAIGDRFSASGFWDEVRRAGATVFDFMGATLTMLHKRPPSNDDGDNPARLGWGVPVPEFAADFEQRFGVQLVELYGSTDAGVPMYHPVDEPRRQGSCGRPIAQYDVRLFDELGAEVGIDDVGEIVIRPNEPSLMSDGYYGMPATSLESRRDLWFHTGDLARRDADGYFYFVGRRTDSIRRRGENISAFEVEEVVKLHPSVLDAAAFGVPSELTEDDVMVAVVVRPGHTFDAAGADHVLHRPHGQAHGAALRRHRRDLAAHADREGREVAAPRTWCHTDDVGSGPTGLERVFPSPHGCAETLASEPRRAANPRSGFGLADRPAGLDRACGSRSCSAAISASLAWISGEAGDDLPATASTCSIMCSAVATTESSSC